MNLFSSNDEPAKSQSNPSEASITEIQREENQATDSEGEPINRSKIEEDSTLPPSDSIDSQPTTKNNSSLENLDQASTTNTTSDENTYINSEGNMVASPKLSETIPTGATAKCKDGTYSFSQHRKGTCSHHGGVMEWL